MKRTQNSKSSADRAAWITYAVVMAGFAYIVLATGAMQMGEMVHDAFCPEHGWAV